MRKGTSNWLVLVLTIGLTPLLALPVGADPQPPPDGLLTGPTAGAPEDIALAYLRSEAATYGLAPDDVADLAVRSSYVSQHTAATHVNLNQRFRGLEVFGADTSVTVAADGAVAFVGGASAGNLRVAASGAARLDPVEAVEAAAEALDLDEPEDLRPIRRPTGAAQETVLTDGGISDEPIPARLGWHPTAEGLRLAWQLVIDDTSDVHLWNATVDARTGALLEVEDWTDEHEGNPHHDRLQRGDGATSAAVQHLSEGAPGPGATVFRSASPVRDGSSYLAFPQESPDDGPRIRSFEPADGTASPFGWHDVSGTPSPDYTITRGNNVHAYTDRDANNLPDPGSEADGGPNLTFDAEIDLNEHPQYYADASVTNLFWWCNVTHDLLYLYGFDEPSGNFQVNNYGRGGVGGDDVRCESMDGSGHDNANFSTPAADGGRPRMQTYIERGSGQPNAVTVDGGPAAGTYLANYARFTPPATTAGTDGTLVLVDDGVGSTTDGCQPYSLPAGSIAVVDVSGACNNYQQVVNAEAAGAVAVVVVQTGANPTFMSGSMDPPVGTPAVSVGAADGATIKAALAGAPAAGSVHRNRARPPYRVGDLDTATVVHEYAHGISNRLTGGPGINCLSGDEQAGEGWSDYYAIVALLDVELDDPERARGIFPYVIYEPPRAEAGLRPRPYSRNMDIQPFTYDSIKTGGWLNRGSLSVPHGVGHGWAAVLWDLTWDLIDRHGFNPNLYDAWSTGGNNLSMQLVTDGLKIQGCAPGLLDARDAIVTADQLLTGGENACTIWASFARRGFGYSAVQGTTNRNDNDEAFDTHPDCRRGFRAPVTAAAADLSVVSAGDAVPLRFTLDGGARGTNILAANSPYSRLVACDTLAVPSTSPPAITPRATPVPTVSPGSAALTVNRQGVYQYIWKTEPGWAGTCRELVLTRDDGVQHRAFFQFETP